MPGVALRPNERLYLAKAEVNGKWEIDGRSTFANGVLSTEVRDFSFFTAVIVTVPLETLQFEPYKEIGFVFDCGTQDCGALEGTATVTVRWAFSGRWNDRCTISGNNLKVSFKVASDPSIPEQIVVGATGSLTRTIDIPYQGYYEYRIVPSCNDESMYYWRQAVSWKYPSYPNILIARTPAQVDVVSGQLANITTVLRGGAAGDSSIGPGNSAIVEWQRSDNNGGAWRPVARSYQHEADPYPLGGNQDPYYAFNFWGVRYDFTATNADQGALIRTVTCYTPKEVAAPPCAFSPPTRINVLQQPAPPSITTPPRSVLVKTGETASFSVVATGAPAPALQWQTREANSNGTWTNVTTGSGATSSNYTTPPLAMADSGREYRVVVTNAVGTVTSPPVTASVIDGVIAPTITTQPAPLGVIIGSDAVFTIAARGTEALSYQWYFNGNPISGANSPVLRLPAVSLAQTGSYRARVSNGAGEVTTNAATLTVTDNTPAPVPASIVTQPVAVTVNTGNTATFAVGATGTAPLSYQWLKNGAPITGATAAYYSIATAAVSDVGSYSVRVSNGVGPGVTSAAVGLTVNTAAAPQAVAITTQPSPQVQPPSGSATFAVAVTGSGPISYQWLKDGSPISGATNAVLILNNVSSNQAGNYSVTVSNSINTVTSSSAALIVLGAPTITTQPTAASATVGQTATFSVVASGSSLRYQWTKNGVAITGATASSYTTPTLTLADSGGVYGVIVYNGAGLVISSPVVLTVTAPVATAFPAGSVPFVAADGVNGAELWMTDGTDAGTVLIKDINPGSSGSGPRELTLFAGQYYFRAYHPDYGYELWKSDGTAAGTSIVVDLYPAPLREGSPYGLIVCNGRLFFSGRDASGLALWKTDGTAAGTVKVAPVRFNDPSSVVRSAACINDVLYFGGSDGTSGYELWRTDGTAAGTTLVKDIEPGSASSSPEYFTEMGGALYFKASYRLWRSDGTAAGTTQVSGAPFDLRYMVANGSTLYFAAQGAAGSEIWKSDGTDAGTVMIKDINVGGGSAPYGLTVLNGIVYFVAEQFTGSRQLWRTDGTDAGTYLVRGINPGNIAYYSDSIAAVNGRVLFLANETGTGDELWGSDGTDGGTALLKDIYPGPLGSLPGNFRVLGNVLLFSAATPTGGTELWRSDGTAAGTSLVKEICAGSCSSSPVFRP